MDNELYHYGIIGQKWGVRRFQNKDGTLTPAGRKRATKLESEYEKVTGKKLNNGGSSSSSNTKSIKDMTDDEIRSRISRIKLENELNSLTPKQVSKGRQFAMEMFNDVLKPAAKNAGKDFIEKKMKETLGITSDSDLFKELSKEAKKAEYEKKIAEANMAKRKDKKEAKKDEEEASKKQTKNDSDNETYSGTVEGVGTSNKKNSNNTSSNKKQNNDPIDVEWRDVTDDDIKTGQSYVNKFLLENKKKR